MSLEILDQIEILRKKECHGLVNTARRSGAQFMPRAFVREFLQQFFRTGLWSEHGGAQNSPLNV